MKPSTIIIGLGNPEPSFDFSRHNAGFMIINHLAEKFGTPFALNKKCRALLSEIDDGKILLIKPDTYMNESGSAVRAVLDFYKIDLAKHSQSIYVIHDDLDIELGEFKIQYAKGPHQHNGLLSVYQHLGTKNIWHVRVGVDGRGGDRNDLPSNYVTEKFLSEEFNIFENVRLKVLEFLKLKLDLKPLYLSGR